MKKSTVMLFLLSLFTFMAIRSDYAFAEEKDYYIRNLNIDVTVNEKKQCVVKERVNVHFNKRVEAFYKTINTQIDDEYINVSKVNVIGQKFEFDKDNYTSNIVIGDRDAGFNGDKEFIIEYTIDYYKRKDNKEDLFNFDVLQDYYDGDIKSFYAKINMPCRIDSKNIMLLSGKYNSYDGNDLNVKQKIYDNIIELSKNSTIETGGSIKMKVGLDKGTFKNIPDFKYNYVIKNMDVDIHITRQQEYYVTQKYSIEMLKENEDDNFLRIMDIEASLDKIYDFKCSSNEVGINSFYDSLELPKKKGRIDFTVTYKQKPALDSDVRFCIYNGSKNVNVEKMNFKINSAVPIKDCRIDCDDDIKDRIKVDKSSRNIKIESNDYLNKNTLIDAELDIDKSKFTRPMKISGLIKFFSAAICFFLSLFVYKKYCKTEIITAKNRYYEPEFIDSLKAGYLFNSEFSKKSASSLIFYWYSHKHINIESFRNNDGYNFKITKLGHLDGEHQDYEIDMFNNLFLESSEVIINKKNGSNMMYKMYSSIKKKFLANMENEKILCEIPSVLRYIINFSMYITVVCLIYDRINESRDMITKFGIYLAIGVLLLKLYSHLTKRCNIAYKNKSKGNISYRYIWIFVSVPFFLVICLMFIYKTTPFIITFMTIIFLFMSITIRNHPIKCNEVCKEKQHYLFGLHNFFNDKDTAELNMLLSYNDQYYKKVFPYIVALDDEKIFINKMKKILYADFYESEIYFSYILSCILNGSNIMV